jgi:hypothetical protein
LILKSIFPRPSMNDEGKDREGHDHQSCRNADGNVEERRFSAA